MKKRIKSRKRAKLLTSSGERMKRTRIAGVLIIAICVFFAASSLIQESQAQDTPPNVGAAPQSAPAYVPKFKGDPARSDSEAAALAYMRVVIRAQKQFNKQYDHYATTLAELVHSGSFTKRMVNSQRG